MPKEWSRRTKPEDPRGPLKRIDRVEISPVTFPANRLARVSSGKSIEDLASLREVEEYLRERGMSKSEAVAFIAQAKRVLAGDPLDVNGGPGDQVAEIMGAVQARARFIPTPTEN